MESVRQPDSGESYYTDALLHRIERDQQCALRWQLYAVSCRGRSTRAGFQPCGNPGSCGVENRTKDSGRPAAAYVPPEQQEVS
jgi:hypothetical protein